MKSDYYDLDTILNNLSHQLLPPPSTHNAPAVNISLGPPRNSESCTPTYWPGQKITGQVKIKCANKSSNITVHHLRIALFGNVQVYGKRPGQPINNGLFDYQRNEQLINTGLRIVKKRFPLHQEEEHEKEDNESTEVLSDETRWKLHCKRDEINTVDSGLATITRVKNKKSPEDRHMEGLIRRVAALDYRKSKNSGVFTADPVYNCCQHDDQGKDAFELNANTSTTHAISFSIRIPTSRRLSGTFEHPHYPISYKVVVVMKCKDDDNNEFICYSTIKVRLEPFVDIHAPIYQSSIQSKPTRQYVTSRHPILNGVLSILSSPSGWLNKSSPSQQTQQNKLTTSYTSGCASFIQGRIELPKQTFNRDQFIPLKLNLENSNISHFNIFSIQICVTLARRINMICSMNEEVEYLKIQSSTVLFKSSEEEKKEEDVNFFKYSSMKFDLSNLIQIPKDSTCTIFTEATKESFTLNYDLEVQLQVTGAIRQQQQLEDIPYESLDPIPKESHSYIATDRHRVNQQEEELSLILPKDPHQHKLKTYTLQLDPLTVIIGTSGYSQT
ncbi:hypothetical protein BD770DRAFT_314134 [Pilaira anomala]|nr:hypothetical protein BD770DRAFT_314134 [Pilaira anomala]